MAKVEKHYAKPCDRCGHSFRKHRDKLSRCVAVEDCTCQGWKPQKGDRLRYRARYRDPGGDQRAKTFDRAVDAEQFLISIEDAKLRSAYIDPKLGRILLQEQAERWYETTAALAPSTRRDYRQLLDRQVLPAFGTKSLASIDTLAIRGWLAKLVHDGLSPKRARKAFQVLSQVLGSAVESEMLARNVAQGLKLPKIQSAEIHFLTAAQVEALAEAIDPPYGTLIRFSAYTGLRPCEVAALRIKRLDLLRGTVRVAEAVVEVAGKLEWGEVKTHEARTVWLPRSIAEELGNYLDGRSDKPDDLVFTAKRGGPLRESKFVADRFKPAVLEANKALAKLPKAKRPASLPKKLRFYDLRHTCASLLIRENASIKAVQAQLGHRTASITLDVYGHLFPDELEGLAGRLEEVRATALAA